MRKSLIASVLFLSLLASCESEDEELSVFPYKTPSAKQVESPDSVSFLKIDPIVYLRKDSLLLLKPGSIAIPDSILRRDSIAAFIIPGPADVQTGIPVDTTSVEVTPVPVDQPVVENPVTTPPVVTPGPVEVPVVPVIPAVPPVDVVPVTPVIPTNTESAKNGKFNIVFSHSFNDNTSGEYRESEWTVNWNNPPWANNNNGYGKIIADGNNKYLMQNHKAGSFGASDGYQWQAHLGKGYDELYFSYRVKFSQGFSGSKLDGKLPGLSGGASNNGGDLPNGRDGWSARYMFKGTSVKFYLYYPEIYKVAGDNKPEKGKKYYGQGPYLNAGNLFKPDVWYTITQRIVMNTPGKSDGLVEGYVNGKLIANQSGIRFRDISSLQIDRVFFGDFFGGSGVPPSKNESISFDDFVVYTYNSSVNVARSRNLNPVGTTIMIPDIN